MYIRPTKFNEKAIETFFTRRFSGTILFNRNKPIINPYFLEWCERFATGHPENYMDNESRKVFEDVLEENQIIE